MLTVRHIERLWDARKYTRLLDELIGWRVEALVASDLSEQPCVCAAALALIRLDELNQPQAAICSTLIRTLIAQQDREGGWGDVMTTSLCIRALSLNRGNGTAIGRGLTYLAGLQQPEGTWPRIPIRRLPGDSVVSAFVLLQLGDNPLFHASVNIQAAIEWFESHLPEIEPRAQKLWSHARTRLVPVTGGQSLFAPIN